MKKADYLAYFDKTYREKLEEHPIFADRYDGFRKIFLTLLEHKENDFMIVETGTLRKKDNWFDGQSSLLFFEFASFFGGTLLSIDTDQHALETCESALKDAIGFHKAKFVPICGNSVTELEKIDYPIDLLYLDSYDFEDLNPLPSMVHPLKEFASAAHIRARSPRLVVAIDDNFSNGMGKGTYLKTWAKETQKDIIHDGLQFIFKL